MSDNTNDVKQSEIGARPPVRGFFPNHDPIFGALRALDLAGSAVAQAF